MGGGSALAGNMSLGQLSNFTSTFKQLESASSQLKVVIDQGSRALSAAGIICSMIDEKVRVVNNNPDPIIKKDEEIEGSMSFENVNFFYPTRPEIQILDNVSLDINKGENVAFVGLSGSGKSTVAELLQRFYDPVEGKVLLDGVDIREYDVNWLHSRVIGYV